MEQKVDLPANPDSQEKILLQVLHQLDSLLIPGSQAGVLEGAYKGINFVIQSIQMLRTPSGSS